MPYNTQRSKRGHPNAAYGTMIVSPDQLVALCFMHPSMPCSPSAARACD